MVQPLTRETGTAVDENPGCDGQEFPCGAPALCSSFRLILWACYCQVSSKEMTQL